MYHDGAHLEWYAEYEDRGWDVGEDGLVEAGGEVWIFQMIKYSR